MKLMDLLTENTNEPRVVYNNTPDGYNGSPEDHKMIKKMKNVYKALYKGRGSVQIYNVNNYPDLDVSYELPPLNTVSILITYPTKTDKNIGYDEVNYQFDVNSKVKYTFHNLETQRETDIDSFMEHQSYDVSYVYKRKFAKFDVMISAS